MNLLKNTLRILFCLFIVTFDASAQLNDSVMSNSSFELKPRKGSFYATWGYNRAHYQNTDIHFKGKDFDFTLYDVSAHDLPEEFDAKIYLNITKLTIPQFDFRVGYFLNEHYSVSAGWDHMKYQVTEFQRVKIDGYIDPSLSEEYGQVYRDQYIDLTPRLVRFEHSDGNNFVRAAIERQDVFMASTDQKWRLEHMIGFSLGIALPWTDSHVFGKRYKNWPHVAGWGTSGLLGLRAHYGNNLYLQYQLQLGYMNFSDVLIQDGADSRADHELKFTELSVSLGYNFRLRQRK